MVSVTAGQDVAPGVGSTGAEPPQRILVGRSLDCQLLVNSPRVSSRHAEALIQGHAGWIRDLGSRYGTRVDEQAVLGWTPFGQDSRVFVAGNELRLTESGRLEISGQQSGAGICAAGLHVHVRPGGRALLQDVSFVVAPGEFVGLMGLSGAGKSTLLKTLVGILQPGHGDVIIDGVDLARNPERARASIGYVPQDDIVHSDLTVREALRYSARLRLPPDTRDEEIDVRIAILLQELEIAHIADVIIGSAERQGISGGQRKRANLALELLSRPPLLLLDEPTSGLSSEDAANVFELLRQLADNGHTIVITTHSPSINDFRKLDQVIYLSSGRLVFFGPAYPDSLNIFPADGNDGTKMPDDAGAGLARLTELNRAGVASGALADQYAATPHFERYVATRLGGVNIEAARSQNALALHPLAAWRQLTTLTARFARLKLRNRGSLPVQLAQAPIVAVLLNLVFSRTTGSEGVSQLGRVLFFMAIASIWFGCSNAAREIVGERPILMRERMIGMGIAPYLGSKLVVLGLLSAFQCGVLLAITAWWRNMSDSLALVFVLLWLCSLVGVLMGLLLSAVARSSEAALSATPLLLIPEILLSGLIAPLPDMAAIPRWLSNLAATRWAYEALLHIEGLEPLVRGSFGDAAVGRNSAVAGLALLAGIYLLLVVLALRGNPRRFA